MENVVECVYILQTKSQAQDPILPLGVFRKLENHSYPDTTRLKGSLNPKKIQ